MEKIISSPLTYWGGKRWLVKTILDLIPEGTQEVFSPFLGGGSIEINLAYRGYKVHAYDNYQPLVNFWEHWLADPESVRLAVYELLSLYTNEDLNRLSYMHVDSHHHAAFYFCRSRLPYNGLPNRTMKFYLRNDGEIVRQLPCKGYPKGDTIFKYWEFWRDNPLSTLNVNHADFEQVFWIHNHQFAYIDPPYFGLDKVYDGSRENGFNHEKLRELLGQREKWVLSYNDHPKARELYRDYHIQLIQRTPG